MISLGIKHTNYIATFAALLFFVVLVACSNNSDSPSSFEELQEKNAKDVLAMEKARAAVFKAFPFFITMREKYPLGHDHFSYFSNDGYPLEWTYKFGVHDRFHVNIGLTLDRAELLSKDIAHVTEIYSAISEVRLVKLNDAGEVVRISYAQSDHASKISLNAGSSQDLMKALKDFLLISIERLPSDKDPIENFSISLRP